jgi:hypothetical protein
MHKKLFIFFAVVLLGCNQRQPEETKAIADTLHTITGIPDSASLKADTHFFWAATTSNKSSKLLMKKTRPLSADSLTAPILIRQINEVYADVKIDFVKISNDTIFIKIGNSNFLTEQMGSSGADMYMTEVCYNLTELQNISYVHFSFREGDHASPGTYSRTDFMNVRFN